MEYIETGKYCQPGKHQSEFRDKIRKYIDEGKIIVCCIGQRSILKIVKEE